MLRAGGRVAAGHAEGAGRGQRPTAQSSEVGRDGFSLRRLELTTPVSSKQRWT